MWGDGMERFTSLWKRAMTASAMAGDRERLLEAGMNDYVAKPVRVAAVYATLNKWLNK